MATVHDQLHRSDDLTAIDFGEYLQVLLPGLIQTYGVAERVEADIDAAGMRLAIDLAVPCGLIVNELVTNSLKHAFPDGRAGKVEVRLEAVGDDGVRLTIRDDGVGTSSLEDGVMGLGLKLVRDLVAQIGGTLALREPPGTEFIIRFRCTTP